MRYTFICCLILTSQSTAFGSEKLTLRQDESRIQISQSGKTVLVYNIQSPPLPDGVDPVYQRSGFLHPVMSPMGRVVTDTFPRDHLHQHGVFSAWVNTTWNERKIDFWNLAGKTGRVLHNRVLSTSCAGTQAQFSVELIHRAASDPPMDVISEIWTITAHSTDGSYHCFDIQSTQSALTNLPLQIHQHHYGGMACRGPSRWLRSSQSVKEKSAARFLTDAGWDRRSGNHQSAHWVAMFGGVDSDIASITVLSHRDNFRSPQKARLHPSKPYFCFAPCVDSGLVIDTDHPYSSAYRFLITDAAPDTAYLTEHWNSWVNE